MSFKFHHTAPGRIFFYALGRGLLAGMDLIGLRAGRAIGRAIYWADVPHRRMAIRNVTAARDLVSSEAEARALVRRMYEHLGMMLAELAVTDRLLRTRRLDTLVDIRGMENIEAALARGRGAVLAVAHLGNWESAGIQFCAAHRPIHSIVRPLDNPLLDRYLETLRQRTGQVVIPKWNAADKMRETLQANHLLGVLMDQNAGRDGVFVDFFGRPASTVKSAAILCLRYKSPALPLNIYRHTDGRIRMDFEAPVWPEAVNGEPDRIRAFTQILTSKLEEFIRGHPEQWLWMHRRWRNRPDGSKERD